MNKTLPHKIASESTSANPITKAALHKLAYELDEYGNGTGWRYPTGFGPLNPVGTASTSAADIQPGARATSKPAGYNFLGGFGGSMIANQLGLGRRVGGGVDRMFGIEDSAPVFSTLGSAADEVGGWMLGQRYLTKQNLGRALGAGWKAVRHPILTGKAIGAGAQAIGRGAHHGYRVAAPAVKALQPALSAAGTAVRTGGGRFMRYVSKSLPYILKALRHVC